MPQEQTSSSLNKQKTASVIPTAGTTIMVYTQDNNHHTDFHAKLETTFSTFGKVNSIESHMIPPIFPTTEGKQKVAIVIMGNTADAKKAQEKLDTASIDGSRFYTVVLEDWEFINVRAGEWDHERPSKFVTEKRRLKTKLRNKFKDKPYGPNVTSGSKLWE